MIDNIKDLKELLEKTIAEIREKGPSPRSNLTTIFYATRIVIRVFHRGDTESSKEAEKILVKLLRYESDVIQFLALYALLYAKSQGRDLNWETEIKILQFTNNPVNQEVYSQAKKISDSSKLEKANLN